MVQASNNPKDITLVTSDNDLARRARSAGCRVMGCAEFAARLSAAGATPEDEKPLAGDIDEWERLFSGPRKEEA